MIDYWPDGPWVFECCENYVRLLELNRDYYWIIDRFHLSTATQYAHRHHVHLGAGEQRVKVRLGRAAVGGGDGRSGVDGHIGDRCQPRQAP